MVKDEYFIHELDSKRFKVFVLKWDKVIHNFKNKLSDKAISEKLQRIIETCEDDLPKLESITKGEPEDYMALKTIKYTSNEEEFCLEIKFESPLKTHATFKTSYLKNKLYK